VKPGITGWAQVKYPYGSTVEDALEKLQYDLYYIKNMSIFLDLLILLKSVQVVLFARGARLRCLRLVRSMAHDSPYPPHRSCPRLRSP